nr:MAG TPA: hypothetical protein [Myoviridae sp. ctTS62]
MKSKNLQVITKVKVWGFFILKKYFELFEFWLPKLQGLIFKNFSIIHRKCKIRIE